MILKNSKKSTTTFLLLLGFILLIAACNSLQSSDSLNADIDSEEYSAGNQLNENIDNDKTTQEEEIKNYIVAVANEDDNTLSIIHYPEGIQEVITLEGKAHNVEVNKATQLAWVTITPAHDDGHGHSDNSHGHSHDEDTTPPTVVAYDLMRLEKVEEYIVGDHPAHVTVSLDGNIVIVTNAGDNTITIIDRSAEITTTVNVGEYPHGLRISPNQKYAYIANMRSGDISIIDLIEFTEVKRLAVGNGVVQTGFSHDGKYAFVGLHLDNQLAVINTVTQEIIKKVDVGIGPVQMYASYDNQYLIVANQGSKENPSNTITIINLDTLDVVKEVTLGLGAHGVVISSDSRYAFVTNMFEETISVVDLNTLIEVERIKVGGYPNGISIN